MPISRSTYQIDIKTNADSSGIKQATKGIKGLGEAAEQSLGSHKALHESLRLAGQAAGGALGPFGELAHFMANPYLLATEGAVLAIKMLVDQHKEFREAMVKNTEAARDQAEQFRQNHLSAMREAADATNTFAIRMDHLRDSTDKVTLSMERQITIAKQNRTETESLVAAKERLYEANIKEAEAAGQITSTEGDALIQHAQREARRQKDIAEDQEAQRGIAAKQQAAAREQGAITAAQTKIPGERADLARLDEMMRDAQDRINDATTAKPDLDKAAAEAQVELARLREKYNEIEDRTLTDSQGFSVIDTKEDQQKRARFEMHKAEMVIDRSESNQNQLDKQNDLLDLYKRQKETAEANIKRDQDLIASKQLLIDTYKLQIQQAQDDLAAHQANRSKIEAIDDQTERVKNKTDLEKKINAGTATEDEIAKYDGLSGRDHTGGFNRNTGQYEPPQFNSRGQPRTAAGDVSDIAEKAKKLLATLGRKPAAQRNPDDLENLHLLIDYLLGAMESSDSNVRSLVDKYQTLIVRAQEMQTQINHTTQRMDTGPNGG